MDVGVLVIQVSLINYYFVCVFYVLFCVCYWDIDLVIEGVLEELVYIYMYLENIYGIDYKLIELLVDVILSLDYLVYWSDQWCLLQMNYILQMLRRVIYFDFYCQIFSS